MKSKVLFLALFMCGCGAQTIEESYLEEYLINNPNPNMISVPVDEASCWMVDGEPDRYLGLTKGMGRGEVFAAAADCTRLGAPVE